VVVDVDVAMVVSGSNYSLLNVAVWACIGHHFKI
jgi:hypothetical protein